MIWQFQRREVLFIMDNEVNIFNSLQEEIMLSDLPETEKDRRISMLSNARNRKINLMLVGASGSGKSSTINALFDMSVAKVGVGADPETKEITKFDFGNFTIWDTPGLGDNVIADKIHIKHIAKKLSETDKNENPLIDLVLVVLDASSKDLSVSYDVINNTLIPILGRDNAHRILIGLNQSDLAMKGRNWDIYENAPNEILQDFLSKKCLSVKRRIYEATGVMIEPVCYSAGYTDGSQKQEPYNLSKLLYYILTAVPSEKRIVLADKLNTLTNWSFNDSENDYTEAVKKSFWYSLLKDIIKGIEEGAVIGGYAIGVPGIFIGGLAGAVIGSLRWLVVKPLFELNLLKTNENLYKSITQVNNN